ncbi:HNH endonuclease [Pedobacter glucosidilyticus]|uniref:HNH endonuclease n=1 Tax=Pedobacter glucosidilyticus TaxID=1122941 RepID=UPI00040644B3|nr:HNH endonuclease [Pedobacter glucosidilyticus]
MNDPTQSKYRHISFKGETAYRRFIKAEDELKSNHFEPYQENIPAHGTYGALLFRPEWKAIREEILARDKTCVICYNKSDLQVHHRQYHFIVRENKFKLPWEYPKYLLITLCESCHRRGHNKFKVPTINI